MAGKFGGGRETSDIRDEIRGFEAWEKRRIEQEEQTTQKHADDVEIANPEGTTIRDILSRRQPYVPYGLRVGAEAVGGTLELSTEPDNLLPFVRHGAEIETVQPLDDQANLA